MCLLLADISKCYIWQSDAEEFGMEFAQYFQKYKFFVENCIRLKELAL